MMYTATNVTQWILTSCPYYRVSKNGHDHIRIMSSLSISILKIDKAYACLYFPINLVSNQRDVENSCTFIEKLIFFVSLIKSLTFFQENFL